MHVQRFTTPPVFQKKHYAVANRDTMHLVPLDDSQKLCSKVSGTSTERTTSESEGAMALLSLSPSLTGQTSPLTTNPLEALCSAAENRFSLGPAQNGSGNSDAFVLSKGSLFNRTLTVKTKKTRNKSKTSKSNRSILHGHASLAFSSFPSVLELKYKPIYNKGGRIGIYDDKQRNKLVQKWLRKRKKRVWIKKVRYSCRKNLAENRVRVKGRFVSTKKK